MCRGSRSPLTFKHSQVGEIVFCGIPPAPRGTPQIEVTFNVDAELKDGFNVTAEEKTTGRRGLARQARAAEDALRRACLTREHRCVGGCQQEDLVSCLCWCILHTSYESPTTSTPFPNPMQARRHY